MNDIDELWEYGNPAESERRFRAAIDSCGTSNDQPVGPLQVHRRLELMTQLARALGLQRRFDEAHACLDEVESSIRAVEPRASDDSGSSDRDRDREGGRDRDGDDDRDRARVKVRLHLERGRALNSAGDRVRGRACFQRSWDLASASPSLEDLAVDAAHMMAISHGGSELAIEWNQRGIDRARASKHAKARALLPAMSNNLAWDLHELGRFGEALEAFEAALAAWRERGREPQVRIARWSVARCLRSLERHERAIEILRALESEIAASGGSDGFIFEELAENLAALGRIDEARPMYARAAAELAKNREWAERESTRLSRLERLASE